MKIRELFSKIRKGVKAGMAAATESNELNDSRIVYLIDKFMRSNQRKMMLIVLFGKLNAAFSVRLKRVFRST